MKRRLLFLAAYTAVCAVLFCVPYLYAAFSQGQIDIWFFQRFSEAACGTHGKAAAWSVLCSDSTAHKLQLSNNNGAYANLLTDANASIPDAALSSNVALKNANNAWSASQSSNGDNTLDLGDTTHRWRVLYGGRLITGASTPTVSATGLGSTGTSAVDTGSSDLGGTVTMTPGGVTIGAGPTVTLTFSTGNGAYGTNAPPCIGMLGNGTGTWDPRATVIGGTMATTSAIFNTNNNVVNLTSGSTYKLHYHCFGK